MPVTHEPWLVALSLFLAIQGSCLGLAVQVGEAIGLRRRLLIAAAAISLAFAVWTMHFIGMLAARLPFPVDYLVLPTLLSLLICVIVVGAAVFAANAGPLTRARLAAAAVFMGLGIVSMHYTGMTALHASAHMTHSAAFLAGSVAIAASGLALWVANPRGGRPPLLFSATALGIAIAGMHYTAMAGVTIFPHAVATSDAPALSTDLLAIVVAMVAFLVSGIFLLALVPDRAGAQSAAAPDTATVPDRSTVPVSRSRLGWLKSRLNQKIDLALPSPASLCSGDCHHGFAGRKVPFSSRTKHRQCPPSRAAERPSQGRSP